MYTRTHTLQYVDVSQAINQEMRKLAKLDRQTSRQTVSVAPAVLNWWDYTAVM